MDSLVIFCSSTDKTLGLATFSSANGQLGAIETVPYPEASGPNGASPLGVSPDGNLLYVSFRGEQPAVLSFKIDYQNIQLNYLGQSPLPDNMVHVSTDATGKYLFSASYGAGTFAVSKIADDGVAGQMTQIFDAGMKAHCTVRAPGNRFVFVPSIEAEAIIRYSFDAQTGHAEATAIPAAKLPKGAGPRHLVFHPNGNFAYLVNELNGTVTAFSYASTTGDMTTIQTVDITPSNFLATPSASDIHLTPDGSLLYASERGSSSIAGFKVNATTGMLQLASNTSVASVPRGFNIDPTGNWLLSLAQDDNLLEIFAIQTATGTLEKAQVHKTGASPNWIEILPMPTSV